MVFNRNKSHDFAKSYDTSFEIRGLNALGLFY